MISSRSFHTNPKFQLARKNHGDLPTISRKIMNKFDLPTKIVNKYMWAKCENNWTSWDSTTLLYLDIGSMGFYGSVWEWGFNHHLRPFFACGHGWLPMITSWIPWRRISWILVFNMNKHGFNHSIHWPPCFCSFNYPFTIHWLSINYPLLLSVILPTILPH